MTNGYDTPHSAPLFASPHIPHYYGDYVRLFFVIVAIISAVSIPVWGDILPVGTLAQIVGIVMLVLLAGLTNPHGVMILWVDVIVSALGVVLLENAAISYYSIDMIGIFLVRELLVLFLLLSLYLSLKTVRAVAQHTIGHTMKVGEFEAPEETTDEDSLQAK